tara:strand:- start:145 stop:411 length:267 start_codon:yes stop_codon:yes gene_type:complete
MRGLRLQDDASQKGGTMRPSSPSIAAPARPYKPLEKQECCAMAQDKTPKDKAQKPLRDDILRRLKAHDEAVKDRPLPHPAPAIPRKDS